MYADRQLSKLYLLLAVLFVTILSLPPAVFLMTAHLLTCVFY